MGIMDGNFRGVKKFFGRKSEEEGTAKYIKPGPSSESLEARLESDYEDLTTEISSSRKTDTTGFGSDVEQLEATFVSVESPTYSEVAEAQDATIAVTELTEIAEDVVPEQESQPVDVVYAAAEPEPETIPASMVANDVQEAAVQENPKAENDEENAMSNEVSTVSDQAETNEDSKKGTSLSHISEEAVVYGDIATDGHIEILGKVKGRIEAKGNIAVQGDVKGDIAGSKIGLYNCKVKGNLSALIGVVADTTSLIIGDVKTKSLIIDGRLKGDIDAENIVVIKENGYFLGDIVAGALSIENGAIVNGNIKTLVEGDVEAPFEE